MISMEVLQAIVNRLNGLKQVNDFLATEIIGIEITIGSGSPETVVIGSPGDLYLDQTGGAASTFFIKETGVASAVGWAGI